MLNANFAEWVASTFRSIAFQGSPKSMKYKFNGSVIEQKDLFNKVMDIYKAKVANNEVANYEGALLISNGSQEAKEIEEILFNNARENKKAHGKHEEARRAAGVGGSMSDELVKVREPPKKLNDIDMQIFNRFRIVRHNTVRMLYFAEQYKEIDSEGNEVTVPVLDEAGNQLLDLNGKPLSTPLMKERLIALGVISENQGQRGALADLMKDKFNFDIIGIYETAAQNLSNQYNTLQAMKEKDIETAIASSPEGEWPEMKALHYKTLDSVMEAYIAHCKTSMVPALPWVLGNIDLYKVKSSEPDNKNSGKSIHWLSGLTFQTRQGVLLDAKNYYVWALGQSQYFPTVKRPDQFGDIYKIRHKPTGSVVDWKSNPILRSYWTGCTENQIKVSAAFWYCVVARLETPCLLEMNHGGNGKNAVAMLIREEAAAMWDCPKENVMFKLQGDQLKDENSLVQGDGMVVRPYLDYLFVFYDEIIPSREMWNTFKTTVGAEQPSVNVKQLYVDKYPVTGFPVPMYMTRNSFMQVYEKKALFRRLVVIRTDADNTFITELTQEERRILKDRKSPIRAAWRKDAFATIMDIGKKAYKEIQGLGGMECINSIFPEFAKVFSTCADDFEKDVKEFYASLFEGTTEDEVQIKASDIVDKFGDFTDTEPDKAMETRLLQEMLNMNIDNDKQRVRVGKGQTTKYVLHRPHVSKVISSDEDKEDAA